MNRFIASCFRLEKDTNGYDILEDIFDGSVELVYRKGHALVYTRYPEAEDKLLEMTREGKAEVIKMPPRYTAEGDLLTVEKLMEGVPFSRTAPEPEEMPPIYTTEDDSPTVEKTMEELDAMTWAELKIWLKDNGLEKEYDLRSETKTREKLAIDYP